MLRIYCKNTGTCKEFQEGTTLLEMVDEFEFDKPYDIISAKVNNVSEGLKFRVFNNRDVEFLDYRSYSGRNVYCRSLCFLLTRPPGTFSRNASWSSEGLFPRATTA